MIQDLRDEFPVPESEWEFREDPLVVDFVLNVDNVCTDHEAMEECARAVVSFMDATEEGPAYDALRQWLRGPFRKIVRHAHEKEFRKAQRHAREVHGYVGDNVLVFPVRTAAAPDPKLKRLRIEGLALDPERAPETSCALRIGVPERASTGKACAQAAHVAQLSVLTMDDEMLAWWIGASMPVNAVRIENDADMESDVRIEDMGLTEPGKPLISRGWFPGTEMKR